jgi:hypothetical protein
MFENTNVYKLQVPNTVKNIRILPFTLLLTPISEEELACLILITASIVSSDSVLF